jgi:hypothetical protein
MGVTQWEWRDGPHLVHATLAKLCGGLSGIGPTEAKLTHDEACGQLKGPQSASLHRDCNTLKIKPFL